VARSPTLEFPASTSRVTRPTRWFDRGSTSRSRRAPAESVSANSRSVDSFRAEKPRLWHEARFVPRDPQPLAFALHPDGQRIALAAMLETSVKTGLDKAVADGVLTQAQADQMLSQMGGNFGWMISHMGNGGGFGPGGCHGNFVPQTNS
jgi:hypothetical protein